MDPVRSQPPSVSQGESQFMMDMIKVNLEEMRNERREMTLDLEAIRNENQEMMDEFQKMMKEVIVQAFNDGRKEIRNMIDSMRTKRENKIKKGLIKRYETQEQVDPDPEDLGENKDTSVTYETALIEHKEIETFEKEICPEKYEIREENSFEEKMDDHQEEYIPENNTDNYLVEAQEEENKIEIEVRENEIQKEIEEKEVFDIGESNNTHCSVDVREEENKNRIEVHEIESQKKMEEYQAENPQEEVIKIEGPKREINKNISHEPVREEYNKIENEVHQDDIQKEVQFKCSDQSPTNLVSINLFRNNTILKILEIFKLFYILGWFNEENQLKGKSITKKIFLKSKVKISKLYRAIWATGAFQISRPLLVETRNYLRGMVKKKF